MSEMVQLVAKAMRDELGINWPYTGHAELEDVARAAIEAMRTPTDAMIAAGFATGEFENDAAFAEPGMASRVFAAMIDAALQESK